jgi:hypothetical protein
MIQKPGEINIGQYRLLPVTGKTNNSQFCSRFIRIKQKNKTDSMIKTPPFFIIFAVFMAIFSSSCVKKPWWENYQPKPQEWETCKYPRLKMTTPQVLKRFHEKIINVPNGWNDPKTGAYRIYLNINAKNKKIEDVFDVILDIKKEEVTQIYIADVEPQNELNEIFDDSGYKWESVFSIDLFGVQDKDSPSNQYKTTNGYVAIFQFIKSRCRWDLSQYVNWKEM